MRAVDNATASLQHGSMVSSVARKEADLLLLAAGERAAMLLARECEVWAYLGRIPSLFINASRPQPQPRQESQDHPTAHPHYDPAPQQTSPQPGPPPPQRCPVTPGGVLLQGQGWRSGRG